MIRFWKKGARLTSQSPDRLPRSFFKTFETTQINSSNESMENSKAQPRKSRIKAIYRSCSFHLIPVCAALALVILNTVEYYVGNELSGPKGYDDLKFSGLLFAAKLHEVLIVASLGFIVFTYVQEELVNGEGVPFGVLTAGMQISQVTFLFVNEFWSLFWAEWERKRKKWTLITLLFVCTLLGLSVAPSSANLMRPRLDNWASGGTKFWLNATDEIFLTNSTDQLEISDHCNTYSLDLACPYGNWDLIALQYHSFWPTVEFRGFMPESIPVTSSSSSRIVNMRHQSEGASDRIGIWENRFTVVTVPLSAVADALTEIGSLWLVAANNHKVAHQFQFRNDVTFYINTTQPISQVQCNNIEISSTGTLDSALTLEFPRVSATCKDDFCEPEDRTPLKFDDPSLTNALENDLNSSTVPVLRWLNVDDVSEANNASIYAVALFPNTTDGESRLFACSIDSRRAPSTNVATRNNPKSVNGVVENFNELGTHNADWPRIKIGPSWADILNPNLPAENATVFSETTSIAGMWNSSRQSNPEYFFVIVETILATMITNGLGRASYNTTLVGNLKESGSGPDNWKQNMIPDGLGPGGYAYTIDAADESKATEFEMRAQVNGYAWSHTGTAHLLSIMILLIYVLFAVAHSIYMIVTGLSTVPWATMSEITGVAMSSRQPEKLLCTTAANDSMIPLTEKFFAKESEGRLQYVSQTDLRGTMRTQSGEP